VRLLGVFVLALALAGSAAAGDFTLRGTVTRVVDGDTLDVRLSGGRVERVRLIGIDTPELGTCMAGSAMRAARTLAEFHSVTLKGDATQATRDRYGRLLAYVWVAGKRDLGYQLLERGLGRVYVYERPFARLAAYRSAEALGRQRPNSVWTCGSNPPPTSGRCDPSYPDFCIPPPPPDLDCKDVAGSNFRVVGADPHRFDGDHDGVGCED
jgi:micrococcal nuclease